MAEYEEVGAGILRLVAALENEGNAAGEGRQGGSPALCFSCGALTKGSGEVTLLSVKKSEVLLRALLVSQEDEEKILRRMKDLPVGVCGACDKSLDTLVDLNQQLEDARLEFCGVRRRVGRQMILAILGSLGRKSHEKWLVDVESVEDVFPSKAPKRLKRSKNVRIGTDEVVQVKVEEEECDFDIIAGDVKAETENGDEGLEETRGNMGGDTAAGSTRKEVAEKDVSLTSMKTCRVMLERIREVPAPNPNPATPRKRRRATNESETKKPNNEQQRTKRVAVNGEGSADEEESPEQATSKQDGSRVAGGSCDLPSATERPRRAVPMKKRSSQAGGGSQMSRSTFTRKLFTISRPVRMPNKTSGGFIYRYRCKFCQKLCSSSYMLRRHCYVSHKAEYLKGLPFVCRVCYCVFPSAKTLEGHKKQHESLRCPTCDEYFPFQDNLKVHMRIHTGEKPFACDGCGQKFSRKHTAKEHMAKHSGVRPFVCSCGKGFTQKCHLNGHKTTKGHS